MGIATRAAAALALGLLAPFAGSPALSAPLTAAEAAKVDKIVGDQLAASRAPSASVVIVREGRVAFAKAYGLRRLDPDAVAGVDTRYRIASVSKQFTAAAVLMLADAGKLSLDDPVVRYLPEIEAANHATIRQTLAHTAGFPNFWTLDYLPQAQKQPTKPEAIVQQWGGQAPDFQPGEKWNYSNTGYVILGRLVEKVSGEPLGAFLRSHIFAPLGMNSAADLDGRGPAPGDALGYMRVADAPPRVAELPAVGWTFGCGELAMTASDLARWDIGVIDRRLMSPQALAAMETETRLRDGSGTGYGFGVFVDKVGEHRRIRHNGDLPGFWTENRIYPDDRAAIVVMVNGSYGEAPHALIADGIERMLIPPEAPKEAAPSAPTPLHIAGELIRQIRAGRLDRSRLTPDANAYLSGATLADYQRSFARLGDPLAINPIDGQTDAWLLTWPSVKLWVTLTLKADGKVAEFMAVPVGFTRAGRSRR
jgi:CubicO group peptidase (beta-lactamase class C family)